MDSSFDPRQRAARAAARDGRNNVSTLLSSVMLVLLDRFHDHDAPLLVRPRRCPPLPQESGPIKKSSSRKRCRRLNLGKDAAP